jgi:hypothetical protein
MIISTANKVNATAKYPPLTSSRFASWINLPAVSSSKINRCVKHIIKQGYSQFKALPSNPFSCCPSLACAAQGKLLCNAELGPQILPIRLPTYCRCPKREHELEHHGHREYEQWQWRGYAYAYMRILVCSGRRYRVDVFSFCQSALHPHRAPHPPTSVYQLDAD